ncbi:hypothetical protein AcdelDRAFT_3092, partial [Acidovorax delafieldii 2AN]
MGPSGGRQGPAGMAAQWGRGLQHGLVLRARPLSSFICNTLESMNARWQQKVVFFNVLATLAWLAWQWPRSPLVALAGVAAALAVFGLVLGLQFVAMWRVNRADPAPRPPLAQVVMAWW